MDKVYMGHKLGYNILVLIYLANPIICGRHTVDV